MNITGGRAISDTLYEIRAITKHLRKDDDCMSGDRSYLVLKKVAQNSNLNMITGELAIGGT